MKTPVAKHALSAALSLLVVGCVACKKISYNVTKLEIDPSSLKVKTSGTLFSEPTSGNYYFLFHEGATPSIHHFDKKDAGTPAHRVFFLALDGDNVLQHTAKHEVLLGGPYGRVYADKHCFYKPAGQGDPNSVAVGTYANPLEEDIPAVSHTAPADVPPLTSLSLIRVFHVGPEYLVVSANYEADGNIGSMHVDHIKGGKWTSGDIHIIPKDRSDDSLRQAGIQPGLIETYGIPGHLDIAAIMKAKHLDLPPALLPEERVVLNQHFGWDKVIRQDELNAGRISDTTWLTPVPTQEEAILNPLCDARLAQQQAAGKPTVR